MLKPLYTSAYCRERLLLICTGPSSLPLKFQKKKKSRSHTNQPRPRAPGVRPAICHIAQCASNTVDGYLKICSTTWHWNVVNVTVLYCYCYYNNDKRDSKGYNIRVYRSRSPVPLCRDGGSKRGKKKIESFCRAAACYHHKNGWRNRTFPRLTKTTQSVSPSKTRYSAFYDSRIHNTVIIIMSSPIPSTSLHENIIAAEFIWISIPVSG